MNVNEMTKKITQTIVKRWKVYEDGGCGEKAMREMRGEQSPPTPSMSLGNYFEYLVSGSTGLKSEPPKPVLLKNGELSAPYRTCVSQAERLKNLMKDMNIEILEVNKYVEVGDLAGHIDMIANVNGEKSIIDLKYSGNMDDKWNQFGWQWSDKQTDYHSTQALHYSLLLNLPFYFLVTEAQEDGAIELFKIELSEQSMINYKNNLNNVRDFVKLSDWGALEARPEFNRCSKCFALDCPFRHTSLTIKTINI
jgi:hypothetical protein